MKHSMNIYFVSYTAIHNQQVLLQGGRPNVATNTTHACGDEVKNVEQRKTGNHEINQNKVRPSGTKTRKNRGGKVT